MAGVSTKEIKNRIRSMESTKQITKAMEMVAASKLRRAQAQVLGTRPYFNSLSTAIHDIICSATTADCYSPKVVQATMGAIARVRVHYLDLPECLANARSQGISIYGTFLEGTNIYSTELSGNGIIVMGNEGNGISDEVASIVTHKINIPPFPAGSVTSESLNVGIATAITVAEFRRRL